MNPPLTAVQMSRKSMSRSRKFVSLNEKSYEGQVGKSFNDLRRIANAPNLLEADSQRHKEIRYFSEDSGIAKYEKRTRMARMYKKSIVEQCA